MTMLTSQVTTYGKLLLSGKAVEATVDLIVERPAADFHKEVPLQQIPLQYIRGFARAKHGTLHSCQEDELRFEATDGTSFSFALKNGEIQIKHWH